MWGEGGRRERGGVLGEGGGHVLGVSTNVKFVETLCLDTLAIVILTECAFNIRSLQLWLL